MCGFLPTPLKGRSLFAVLLIDAPDEITREHKLTDRQQAEQAMLREKLNKVLHALLCRKVQQKNGLVRFLPIAEKRETRNVFGNGRVEAVEADLENHFWWTKYPAHKTPFITVLRLNQ